MTTQQPSGQGLRELVARVRDRLRSARRASHGDDVWVQAYQIDSAADALDDALVLSLTPEVEPAPAGGERERLHALLSECEALINPEEHPELRERIDAVLTPCDEAGKCVAPPLPAPPPASQENR